MRSHLALELIGTLWFCLMGFAHMENTVIMHRLALAAGVVGTLYMARAFYKWITEHELKGRTNAKNPQMLDPGAYAGNTRMRYSELESKLCRRNHIG